MQASGRARRSRRDRPCDLCRRQKHICVIPVRGDPCKACQSRKRPCTFDDPPTTRVRKFKTALASSEEPERGQRDQEQTVTPSVPGTGSSSTASGSRKRPRSRGSIFSASLSSLSSSSTSEFSLVSSVLDLVRTSREPPNETDDRHATQSDLFVPANTDCAEQSYISSTAFSDLTFSVEDSHESRFPGDVGFRQVSNDPAMPVFFISPPTLMYGYLAPESQRLWQSACSVLGPGAPRRLIEIYLSRSQPALPVLGMQTFAQTEPTDLAAKGVSYALLTSLIAHATSYASRVYEIRSVHKHLWRQVILPLEDEFRKPSFQTIQTAIVILTSRPAINVAQNHIAMGRVVTAAQLLGLHLDPSAWRVSPRERSLRKRLWWTLLVHDKWRTLWYGRPRCIAVDDWSVPMPTLADLELPDNPTRAQRSSADSYIAWCGLTAVLDPLITDFYTARATSTVRSVEDRLAILEKHAMRLRGFEAELPAELRDLPSSDEKPSEPAASGVRSFQLCKLGVEMTLLRLTSATFAQPTVAQVINAARATISLSHGLVEFLEQLLPAEFDTFWAPYCSFIISAAGAHLLRTAIAVGTLDATLRNTAGVLFARLVVTLTSSHHAAHWDVASLALDRIATLLRSLDGQLPELAPLLQLFGAPNHAPSSAAPRPTTATRAQDVFSSPTTLDREEEERSSDLATSSAAPPPAPFLSPPQRAPAGLPFLGSGGGSGGVRTSRDPPQPPLAPPILERASGSSLPLPPHYSPPPQSSSTTTFLPSAVTLSAAANNSNNHDFADLHAATMSSPMSDQLDPLWWMNTDILSLPDHFGTLPDLFDQAFLGYGGGAGASPGVSHEVTGNGGRRQGEEEDEMQMMTGLEAIAAAAAVVVHEDPLGTGGTRRNDVADEEEEQVDSAFNRHHHMHAAARGGKGAGAGGMSGMPITMIGADGLFDLRGFLENGSGLTTPNPTAAAAATTAAGRQQQQQQQ
ncbi:hypothetical protein B0A53_04402 [Rhodotorula sp. CCFEE 5036]|nr:hypothetical protein B0A53_04402 [Rhodotorula sp. CCFEE 5036]